MEDRLVSRFGLAVGLGMSNGGEPSLAAQIVEIVSEPIGIELPVVIKDDGTGTAKQVIMFCQMSLRTSAVVMEVTTLASIHLVK